MLDLKVHNIHTCCENGSHLVDLSGVGHPEVDASQLGQSFHQQSPDFTQVKPKIENAKIIQENRD